MMKGNAWAVVCLIIMTGLYACGGGGGNNTPDTISSGLKIFVTSRVHNGNFLSDPTLIGGTAIAKADNFCQTDPNRPTDAVYKALLVDGKSRDAVTPVDWVLKPNTAYYQTLNDVRIGVTTTTAIFATAIINLEHNIRDNFGTNTNALSNVTKSSDFVL